MANVKRVPIAVLTIDDGFITDYTRAYDIFALRGLRGTSYLNGQPAGLDGMRADWLIWRTMQAKGWDIQCHTYKHEVLTNLTPSQIQSTLTLNEESFIANGIRKPEHFAYPQGERNDSVRDVVLQHRLTARRTGWDSAHWCTYEEIASREFRGISADIQDQVKWESVAGAIDNACANNGVVIPYFHKVIRGNEVFEYAIKEEYLKQLLDYILQKEMLVMTISQMYAYVLAVLGAGN